MLNNSPLNSPSTNKCRFSFYKKTDSLQSDTLERYYLYDFVSDRILDVAYLTLMKATENNSKYLHVFSDLLWISDETYDWYTFVASKLNLRNGE